MRKTSFLTSDVKVIDRKTKRWIDSIEEHVLATCGESPRMLIYAYRKNLIDYLVMNFDPLNPDQHSFFSITMAVSKTLVVDLEVPTDGEVQIAPQVQDWVDALTIANQLCHRTGARSEFNPC